MRLMQVNCVCETLAHGKISPSVRDEVEGRVGDKCTGLMCILSFANFLTTGRG